MIINHKHLLSTSAVRIHIVSNSNGCVMYRAPHDNNNNNNIHIPRVVNLFRARYLNFHFDVFIKFTRHRVSVHIY